jgi:Ca-activated chloride channel homolog
MIDFSAYQFKNPEFFFLFFIIPILIFWYWRYHNGQKAEIKISGLQPFKGYKPTFRQRSRHVLFLLRLLAICSLIIALARPQSSTKEQNITTEGIDIILAMDISPSMLAEDLKPNRIEAAKKVAMEFIESRPSDRIGLVVFAGESFTQSPLTTDHSVIKNLLASLKSGMLSDGTALGEGLATSVSRIKDSKAKSKVIILLTDGVNNSGSIAPLTASEIAKTFGIRVYTIGVGTTGSAPYPVITPFGKTYQNLPVEIDETGLKKIAAMNDGKYFRANNVKKLLEIYKEIDRLEKTKIEVTEFRKHSEEFLPFALLAAMLLAAELIMRYTIFRSFP